jgi:pyrroloquinoline quinone biosynthesis protein D
MGNARRTLSRLCYAAAPSTRFFFTTGLEALVNETPAAIPLDAQPRLPHGVRLVHNEAHGGWVLLAPERVFKADAIAAEIVKRCTGQATVSDIVNDLAQTYSAPRERILTDVTALLQQLAERRLLEL